MSRSNHTEAQMIGALKQLEAGKPRMWREKWGLSKHTIYAWKAKYGGMDVSEAQEAKQLRDENTRLRKLVADLSLDKEALPETLTAFADMSITCGVSLSSMVNERYARCSASFTRRPPPVGSAAQYPVHGPPATGCERRE